MRYYLPESEERIYTEVPEVETFEVPLDEEIVREVAAAFTKRMGPGEETWCGLWATLRFLETVPMGRLLDYLAHRGNDWTTLGDDLYYARYGEPHNLTAYLTTFIEGIK